MTKLHIMPIPRNEKGCRISGWQTIDWTDEGIQAQYKHQYHNYGLRGDGLLILDVDSKICPKTGRQQQGAISLETLEAEYGKLPNDAPIQETASGGLHYIFALPGEVVVRNSTSLVGLDLDVRSNGGYIVCAPSTLLIDGEIKPYKWLRNPPKSLHEGWENLPAPPQWLIDLATKDTGKVKKPKGNAINEPIQIAPIALKQIDDAEISKIRSVLANIPKDKVESYQDWLKCGIALSNWSNGGDIGLQLWVELSKRGANFEEGVCETKYRGFTPSITNGVSVATLFWMGGSLSLNDEGLVARLHSMVGDKLKYSPSLGWLVFKGGDYVS
jgi:hypothetical protein